MTEYSADVMLLLLLFLNKKGHILLAAGRTRVSRVASAASLSAAKPVVTWTVQESPGVDKAEGEESSEEEDEDDNVTAPIEKALSRGGEGKFFPVLSYD